MVQKTQLDHPRGESLYVIFAVFVYPGHVTLRHSDDAENPRPKTRDKALSCTIPVPIGYSFVLFFLHCPRDWIIVYVHSERERCSDGIMVNLFKRMRKLRTVRICPALGIDDGDDDAN